MLVFNNSLSLQKFKKQMGKFNKVWSFVVRYKYACVIAFFALLIVVLDENSLIHRMQLQTQILELQQNINTLRESNERDSLMLLSLDRDLDAVRRIARERYLMKRDGEDVFVFMDTTSQNNVLANVNKE